MPHPGLHSMLLRPDSLGINNAQSDFFPIANPKPTPTQLLDITTSAPPPAQGGHTKPRVQAFVVEPSPSVPVPAPVAAPSPAQTHPPPPGFILFNDTANFGTPALRVFDLSVPGMGGPIKTFEWKPLSDSYDVTRIRWIARNSTTPFFVRDCVECPTIYDLDLKAGAPPADGAIVNVSTTGAQLVLTSEKVAPYYHLDMALVLSWETNNATGFSRTGVFTVVNGLSDPNERTTFEANASINPNDQFGAELEWPKNSSSVSNSTTTSSSSPSSSPSSTGAATIGGQASGAAGPSHRDAQGGLSTGAKAGIGAAVGVVGILLLLGLLFFLLRRRKANAQSTPRGDPSTASSFLISDAQKMATIEPSSPHLPPPPQLPLDENTTSSSRGLGGGDLADRHDSTVSLDPAAEMPLPTGVSRHLVEEGMTREQILLLEEEERQLDAAIHERAVRRL